MDHTDKGMPPRGLPKWLQNVGCKSPQIKTKAWWGTFPFSHQGSMTPTGMTVCKPTAAELTPHKLPPFHFAIQSVSQSLCILFYRRAQPVIQTNYLATRPSLSASLQHSWSSQGRVYQLDCTPQYSVTTSWSVTCITSRYRSLSYTESPTGEYDLSGC